MASLRRFTFRLYQQRLRKLHPLRYVFWEATLRCNLACRHCGSSCRAVSDARELTTAEVTRAFSELAQEVRAADVLVAITGGEPLLRPDLLEVMGELDALGFRLGMVSNGYSLDAAMAARLREHGLRTISISVDGLRRTHDHLRGRHNSFDRALRALEALTALDGVAAEALTCVSGYNLEELEELYRLLRARGVRRWRLETVIPIGRAAGDARLQLDGAGLRRVLDFVVRVREVDRYPLTFGCEGWLDDYELRARDGFFSCQAGVTIASVLADGGIGACPDIDRAYVQGNVRRDRLADVWRTGFRDFRERAWMHASLCACCPTWKDCSGGAMHMWSADRTKIGCVSRTLREA